MHQTKRTGKEDLAAKVQVKATAAVVQDKSLRYFLSDFGKYCSFTLVRLLIWPVKGFWFQMKQITRNLLTTHSQNGRPDHDYHSRDTFHVHGG